MGGGGMTDWIKWEPGPCPVDPETLVDIRIRDGEEALCMKAGYWIGAYSWWEHLSHERRNDIVAYRETEV